MTDHEALRLLCKLHQPDIAMTLEELDAIRGRAFAKEPAEQPAAERNWCPVCLRWYESETCPTCGRKPSRRQSRMDVHP